MAKLCTGIHLTGSWFSELQQGLVIQLQESDVVLWGQLDKDALESTGNNILDDFLSQLLFENAMQDISNVFPLQSPFFLNLNQLLGLRTFYQTYLHIQIAAVHKVMSTISQMDHMTSPLLTYWHFHPLQVGGFFNMPYHHSPFSHTIPFSFYPTLIHV